MKSYAVIDFSTTGLSQAHVARPTEIAVVMVGDGAIVDRYRNLMNFQVSIPADIVAFTGISNARVSEAPLIPRVMTEVIRFAAGRPIIAHNVALNRKHPNIGNA